MEDNIYTYAVRLDERMPEDYKDHMRQSAREQTILSLQNVLFQPDHPIYTVRVVENEIPIHDFYPASEYRISLEISRVQVRHVEIARFQYEEMAITQLSSTALREIGRRIKTFVYSMFRRPRK